MRSVFLTGRYGLPLLAILLIAGCSGFKDRLTRLSKPLDRFFGVEQEAAPTAKRVDPGADLHREALARKGAGRHEEAAVLFRQAAERGSAAAAYELGLAHSEGRGVERDLDRGAHWINMAAAGGDPRAQYLLGTSYLAGTGVEQDHVRAADYLSRAATQGHARAQYLLAKSFANGLGVPKDSAWAARWYGKAAYQGHAEAQYAYGVVWAAGQGRPKDLQRGYRWLTIAALAGHAQAEDLRAKLASRLNTVQLRDAERAARAFKSRSNRRFADEPTVSYTQQSLNTLGYRAGPVDGTYGAETREALRRFQRANNLQADGRLGPKSLSRLVEVSRKGGQNPNSGPTR